MRRKVRVVGSARIDLHRLAAFLAPKSPTAANRALSLLNEAINSLADHAERGRPGPEAGQRELIVPFGRAGYVNLYHLAGETVFVTGIFHSRELR